MSEVVIRAVSDLHGNLPEIESCNLLLIAGDVCPDFSGKDHFSSLEDGRFKQGDWLDTDFRPWLEKVPADEIVGIAGNHDYVFEHHDLVPDLPWTYLEDAEANVLGFKVYGTPWVPNLPFWAFYGDDRRLKMSREAIPSDLDILMTHGPPYGYGDIVGAKYGPRAGTSVGDIPLRDSLDRINATLHVFGHIHEGRGTWNRDGHIMANVAMVDEFYDPYPQATMEFKLPQPKES
jgi:Icc-related predicted phosphoesterase